MRIPTLTLALFAAALSGSVSARLAKSPKAAAVPGPAYLAARDYAGDINARGDTQKRQLAGLDGSTPGVPSVPAIPAVGIPPTVPGTNSAGEDSDSGAA